MHSFVYLTKTSKLAFLEEGRETTLFATSHFLFNLGRGAEQGKDTVLIVVGSCLDRILQLSLGTVLCNSHSFSGNGWCWLVFSRGLLSDSSQASTKLVEATAFRVKC